MKKIFFKKAWISSDYIGEILTEKKGNKCISITIRPTSYFNALCGVVKAGRKVYGLRGLSITDKRMFVAQCELSDALAKLDKIINGEK
jgi:hypothetical protein